jgi:hypothetical protein
VQRQALKQQGFFAQIAWPWPLRRVTLPDSSGSPSGCGFGSLYVGWRRNIVSMACRASAKVDVEVAAISNVVLALPPAFCHRRKDKMKFGFSRSLILGLSFLASAPFAATQGTLGSTSSGTFGVAANRPATPRQVQVLNLSDVSFTNSDHPDADNQGSEIGESMRFCLVDTYAGQVRLTVSTGNNLLSYTWWQLGTTDGVLVNYAVTVGLPGQATPIAASRNANATSSSLTTFAAVADRSSCGSGNLVAHVYVQSAMPNTLPARTYTDTITVLATPI